MKVPGSVPSLVQRSVRKEVVPNGIDAEKKTRWFATTKFCGLELRGIRLAGVDPTLPLPKSKTLRVDPVPFRLKEIIPGSTPFSPLSTEKKRELPDTAELRRPVVGFNPDPFRLRSRNRAVPAVVPLLDQSSVSPALVAAK